MNHRLVKLAKNPWLLAFTAALMGYTLIGFSLVPFLVQHYTPKLAADLIQRQASVREVQFNPFRFTFEAKDLALNEADGKPVFGLKRLFLNFEPSRFLTSRTITLADLRVEGPAVNLVQDADGKLNVAKIGESLPKSEEPPPPPSDEPPPRILLEHLLLADGSVKFTDESKAEPVTTTVDNLGLELNDFSTLPEREGAYTIDAALPGGGKLAWRGDVSLNPVASSGELAVESFKLATAWQFIKDRLNLAEPKGEIGLGARYKFSRNKDKTELTVEEARFKLGGLGLADGKSPLVELEEIGFEKASVDLAAQTVNVPMIAIRNGKVHAAIDEAGQLNWLNLVKPEMPQRPGQPAAPVPKASTAPAATPSAAAPVATEPPPAVPWKVKVEKFEIAEIGFDYTDASKRGPSTASIGDFGLSLAAEAEAGAGAPKAKVDGLGLHMKQIAVADGGNPLLDLAEIGFENASVDLSTQTVSVPSFAIRKGRIRAAMDEAGQINWLGAAKPEPADTAKPPAPPPPPEKQAQPAPPAEATPPAPSWKAKIDKFEIAEIGLDYADASRKGPFTLSVGDFGLALAAEAEAGSGPPKARVDGLSVHVDRVALAQPGKPAPLFGWDSFQVEGGSLDLEKQEAALQRATLRGGGTAVIREADGTLRPINLFEPKSGPAAKPVPEKKPEEKPEGKPWHFALGEFALQGFGVGVTDRSFTPELAYNFDDIQVSAKSISNDGKTPVAFDTRLKVRQGGSLAVTGTASPKGDAAQARIKVDRFDLKQLQSVVSQYAALKLEGADVSTDLAVNFKQAQPKPSVKATGKADLNGLRLTQTTDGQVFLAWKTLGVSGIDFSLGPDRLRVKEVRILKPEAKVHIFKDKSTNIQAVLKPQKPSAPAAAPKPAAAPEKAKPAGKASPEAPFAVDVERVRLDDAEVDFADQSLVLPFATHITDFDGAVAGISLAPKSRATLKFAGRVGDYGEAKVDGSLSPMDIKNYSVINVVFSNVAMVPLSPYSATFAGRRIQSGKLNLDLQYRIENGKLKSKNDILLENFTLGEAHESPNATNLPLDLAIALLTDGEGKIKASVPVEGDVDNPKFDYGTVVWDAFTTLIKNAVTAPFNALASVFGGSQEKLDAVLFEPARAVIPPPESEKLAKIAQGMAQRPKLKLTIGGRYDPKVDGEALKSLEVRRELAKKLDVELHQGEEPDQPAFSDSATQRALEKIADEKGGADAVQAAFIKETGKPPQRVGALAGLTGKASETPEFYEKLFKHLVENTPLPPSELEALGNRRGQAVLAELAEKHRFDRSRLALGKTEATDDSAGGNVPTKLELGAD